MSAWDGHREDDEEELGWAQVRWGDQGSPPWAGAPGTVESTLAARTAHEPRAQHGKQRPGGRNHHPPQLPVLANLPPVPASLDRGLKSPCGRRSHQCPLGMGATLGPGPGSDWAALGQPRAWV